ncbi:unnamed protein product [Urochloa humidicola]
MAHQIIHAQLAADSSDLPNNFLRFGSLSFKVKRDKNPNKNVLMADDTPCKKIFVGANLLRKGDGTICAREEINKKPTSKFQANPMQILC